MINLFFASPFAFFIWVSTLLIVITIHEYAHAWMSDRMGDPTPRLAGRLTLNPISHLDPIGTLMLLFFRFGWGKPVPIDPFNFRHPRRDAALVSFAGPAANLILATVLAVLIRTFHVFLGTTAYFMETVLTPFIVLSVILALFNLLPVHPLDGGKVLVGLLPADLAYKWDEILEQYGLIILIFLLFPIFGPSPISLILSPLVNLVLSLLLPGTPLI